MTSAMTYAKPLALLLKEAATLLAIYAVAGVGMFVGLTGADKAYSKFDTWLAKRRAARQLAKEKES